MRSDYHHKMVISRGACFMIKQADNQRKLSLTPATQTTSKYSLFFI
ncbi:hypothetical protein PROSTU_00237 [Providencia stuartii ATCC 25827]|uniref:Uncharacterized protein n=1 Tax=Providencia stuartii ATCC 25827 TaxID=471874 RepID=A0AA86YPT3_PROST|nr:hypothetical protein PROSTU_00237 [Providencia stuartii ATCC 25827]